MSLPAINFPWRKLDSEHTHTWPPSQYAPSGKPWEILKHCGGRTRFVFNGWVSESIIWSQAIAYVDPAVLHTQNNPPVVEAVLP